MRSWIPKVHSSWRIQDLPNGMVCTECFLEGNVYRMLWAIFFGALLFEWNKIGESRDIKSHSRHLLVHTVDV
jgi:hypothetical protein